MAAICTGRSNTETGDPFFEMWYLGAGSSSISSKKSLIMFVFCTLTSTLSPCPYMPMLDIQSWHANKAESTQLPVIESFVLIAA